MVEQKTKFRIGFKFFGFEVRYEKERTEKLKKGTKRKTGNRSKKSR